MLIGAIQGDAKRRTDLSSLGQSLQWMRRKSDWLAFRIEQHRLNQPMMIKVLHQIVQGPSPRDKHSLAISGDWPGNLDRQNRLGAASYQHQLGDGQGNSWFMLGTPNNAGVALAFSAMKMPAGQNLP